MKMVSFALLCAGLMAVSGAKANDIGNDMSTGYGWYLNYDWLNQIVNNTPTKNVMCPTLEVDSALTTDYKVALQNSFYANATGSIGKWFPKNEVWAAFSMGPMVNNFGITFGKVRTLKELENEKRKKLPTTVRELNKWDVKDSAYWESQGGVSFYLGTGTEPISVGVFAVATGGWANYLEKTAPTKVYVERAKKYVKMINVGAGAFYTSVGADAVIEKAKGFNYEFDISRPENAEAFERFMAGETTKAYDLSRIEGSGVVKIADTTLSKFGKSFGVSLSTPFIPIISLRGSQGKDYNHEEELSVWDEHVVKDYGVYTKQSASRLVGLHYKRERSFKGGMTSTATGPVLAKETSVKFYGQFKHAYQSDWGQEGRLENQIDYAKDIAGFDKEAETCVKVPNFANSLKYNQVILQMNLSDEYMRAILGLGNNSTAFLNKLQARASYLDGNIKSLANCSSSYDPNNASGQDRACRGNSVDGAFLGIKKAVAQIKASMGRDRNGFSAGMANFGKAVWSNPGVFKAFYEQGKTCGMDFSFEVSGQRINRFYKNQKYGYTPSCVNN
ncbi:hypothetical protein [Bdellovibrio sp. HCB274]|uniref:hypothetical protein n=1 Tax=Bdellovibrio sp. HCB274 TaxID=3394361 RepID=UPI0039B651F9